MNAAQVRKFFKNHMIPFLEQHRYSLKTSGYEGYYFENIDNAKLRIAYQFQKKYPGTYEVNVIIARDDPGVMPYVGLTAFVDDPAFPDATIFSGNWYFDTPEEMVGAFEEQANIFIEKAFKWLNRDGNIADVMKIGIERAAERARTSKTVTKEENERLIEELRVKLAEWQARRVKPKVWNVETK